MGINEMALKVDALILSIDHRIIGASARAKEEIEELREFKADLQDVLDDIQSGDIEEDECKEIIDDIKEAQKEGEAEEEDFGFTEEEVERILEECGIKEVE